MPIIKSAKKRMKLANKAAIRNSKTKRSLKAALKSFNAEPSKKSHATAQSNIDKAMKKGLIHKNKASRLKKRAAATAKTAKVNVARKPTAKKSTPKKTTVKKTPTKTTKNN